MEINVKKASGILSVNSQNIRNFIYDLVCMVPGITPYNQTGLVNKVKRALRYFKDSISIIPLGPGVIGVEVHIILNKGVDFKTIATQLQDLIIFSVKEQYGIEVNFVDVIIEGTEL